MRTINTYILHTTLALTLAFSTTASASEYITLRWRNPKTNEDGSPLYDLEEIRIYENGLLLTSIVANVAGSIMQHDVGDRDVGTWTYALSAVDVYTNESQESFSLEIVISTNGVERKALIPDNPPNRLFVGSQE